MNSKNTTFAETIASKFINSSNSGKLFLERNKIVIKLSITVLTILFFILLLRRILISGRVPSIATLAISLLLYLATIITLTKLTPIYTKFIQKKRIETCIKKCISKNHNRTIISSSKFELFTSVSTDNQLFSNIKYAHSVSQIDNVVIELHRPSLTKGGTLLVINIVDPEDTDQQLLLEKTKIYINKKGIPFDSQL